MIKNIRLSPFHIKIFFTFFVTLFVCFGLTLFYIDFSKISFGPIYLLEICFIAWFVISLLVDFRISFRILKSLMPILLFCAWGLFLLSVDLLSNSNNPKPFDRILHHSILFIYPLLWSWVGYWTYVWHKKNLSFLVIGVLLLSGFKSNLAVGPVLAIPLIGFAIKSWKLRQDRRLALRYFLLTIICGLFVYVPFWKLSLGYMQRSSFFLFLAMVVASAWTLTGRHIKKTFFVFFIALSIYFIGAQITVGVYNSYIKSKANQAIAEGRNAQSIEKKTILDSFSHGDDRDEQNPESGRFQFRFRKFQWKTAIDDWKTRPWIGVGFIPEVPSWHQVGIKNDGIFADQKGPMPESEKLGGKPASGPHNSYLSVLARMGPIGLILMILIIAQWIKSVRHLMRRSEPSMTRLALFFIPFNGFLFSVFNVGLESPHASVLLWIFYGLSVACSKEVKQYSFL